ncbi:MAG TPA: hypothetical protein VGK59_23695 [Ohtaekwangia sp.]
MNKRLFKLASLILFVSLISCTEESVEPRAPRDAVSGLSTKEGPRDSASGQATGQLHEVISPRDAATGQ